MIRRWLGVLCLSATLCGLPWAPGAWAQQPNLRAMMGKPLPVPDLPPGTVTVRVARRIPANAVASTEIIAIVTTTAGESRKRTATTGADGRATFDALAPGARFTAEVTVDGETLKTSEFTIPSSGGLRTMLISGLGGGDDESATAGEAPAEEADGFRLGAVTGSVSPADGTPIGSLEIELVDGAGKPIPGKAMKVGQVSQDATGKAEDIKVHRAVSDGNGVVRFSGLPTGEQIAYAGVIEHEGMRLSTDAFRLPTDKGARGRIKALLRTPDTAAVRIDKRSKLVVDAREEAIAVFESLLFSNSGERVFDPGEDGLFLPLPEGHTAAQEVSGGAEVKPRTGGVTIKTTVPPNSAAAFATSARFAFALPGDGASIEFEQLLPLGMEAPYILVPAAAGLTLAGHGLRRLGDETDQQGNKVHQYETGAIPPGGTLRFSVSGLRARDRSGHKIAGTLASLVLLAGVLLARRPKNAIAARKSRAELTDRREKLFGELVALERRRTQAAAAGNPAERKAALEDERRALLAKIETVYRDLGALDAREGMPS